MNLECTILFSLLWTTLAYTPQLRRSVGKSGFHRELSTSIKFLKSELFDAEDTEGISCGLLFTEVIPSGAYVDPYQIASLKLFGGPDAVVKDKVDIEKPEYLSQPHTVEIFTKLHNDQEFWHSNYTLPIHLRYHATSDVEEFATVTFNTPEVAARCWNTATGQPHGSVNSGTRQKSAFCSSDSQQLCEWTVLETAVECEDHFIVAGDLKSTPCQQDSISVRVPVGRSSDYNLVTSITLLFTVGGCLFLAFYVINKDMEKKPKQH